MTDLPFLKIKSLVNFPANAFGRTGISVTPQGGNFYLDVNYSDFVPVTAIPPGAPNEFVLVWNNVLNNYVLAPVSLLGVTGGIVDAPSDNNTYGRINAAWQKVLALAGGTMTGRLFLAADPAVALEAATKEYVDNAVLEGITPTQQIITAPGDVTVQNLDGLIVLNKTVGEPTNVLMPPSATKVGPVKVVDWKGDADVNNFKIIPNGTDLISGMPQWVVGGGHASVNLNPVRGSVNGYAV
jgi:hypothetical protein